MTSQPYLPPELEEVIIGIAAQEIPFPWTPRNSLVNLQLTARRFYDWILSFFFRVLDKERFRAHLRRMGPRFIDRLRYLGKYTTHLSYTIDTAVESDYIRLQLLVECCPNLVDLTVWHTSDTLWKIHETVSKLSNLRRLSANFGGLQNDQILCPTYLRLTHLDLLGGIGVDIIQNFQNLTHLCINGDISTWRSILDRVTDKHNGCPVLRVIVCMCELEDIQEYDDQRYVVLIEGPHYESDWVCGADGGVDAWEFSERIVIARRSMPFYYLTLQGLRLTIALTGGYLQKPSNKVFNMLAFYLNKDLNSEGQAWWKERDQWFRASNAEWYQDIDDDIT
ncbi:hypothetical protein BJ165DRAFT_1456552 [Panaeolus papilionaceus]|nr:hypothetical protein BJ165DRAFT_1456552 [Panaeolus papilionaceus]